jgi:hypothetical protein
MYAYNLFYLGRRMRYHKGVTKKCNIYQAKGRREMTGIVKTLVGRRDAGELLWH